MDEQAFDPFPQDASAPTSPPYFTLDVDEARPFSGYWLLRDEPMQPPEKSK